jgi:hypothetical protein
MDDEDDNNEKNDFGPVVDHTPIVQPSAVSSVAGLMAVNAQLSEVADDLGDNLDERTGTIEEHKDGGSDYDLYNIWHTPSWSAQEWKVRFA